MGRGGIGIRAGGWFEAGAGVGCVREGVRAWVCKRVDRVDRVL